MISVYSEKLICVAVKRQDNPPLTIVAEDRSGSKAKRARRKANKALIRAGGTVLEI